MACQVSKLATIEVLLDLDLYTNIEEHSDGIPLKVAWQNNGTVLLRSKLLWICSRTRLLSTLRGMR